MSRGAQAPITFQMAIPTETMISQYSVRIPALAMQPIGSRVKIRQIVPTRTVTVTSLWLRLRQLVAQTEANAAWRAPLLGLRWPLCDPYDPTLAVLAKGGVVRGAAFFFQRSPHGPSRYCPVAPESIKPTIHYHNWTLVWKTVPDRAFWAACRARIANANYFKTVLGGLQWEPEGPIPFLRPLTSLPGSPWSTPIP
jgi:hypothetical protein